MEYNIKLEIELIKLGFKRVWLSDKSGYWFEKKFKFRSLDFKLIVETDNKLCLLEVKTYEYNSNKLYSGNYEVVSKIKCDLKSIKEVLKKYK